MVFTRKEIDNMMTPFTGLTVIFHLIIIFIYKRRKVLVSFAIALIVFGIIGLNLSFSVKGLFGKDSNIRLAANLPEYLRQCKPFETNIGEKNIILRVDDIQASAWREVTIRMTDDALENSMPLVLAVIPEGIEEDDKLYRYLRSQRCNIELAQHGWDHNKDTGGVAPEFGSLSKEEAYKRIIEGKAVMEKLADKPPVTFIPPNNYYSAGTAQALDKAGFINISSEGDQPFDYTSATFDSTKNELISVPEILERCIEGLNEKDLCVVMLHPQDYATDGVLDEEKYEMYSELLDELKKLNVSFVTMENLSNSNLALVKSEFSSWIPCCDENRSLSSLEIAKGKLGSILPVWYQLERNGQITETIAYKKEITSIATDSKISIMPTITNEFKGEYVTTFLDNEELQLAEIEKLVRIALDSGYSGWDLDWEEILESDRERFSDSVELFARHLHENNLLLSVTVHAQTGQPDDWVGSKGQDWSAISEHADFIRIMAYDFHNVSTQPGPITPLDKLEQVLDYAISIIPKDKIVLGLPTYGYDWSEEKVVSFQYEDVIKQIDQFGGSWSRDNESFALVGNYTFNGMDHTIWFEDKESTAKKIAIARSFGVYQFTYWRLGGEDQRIWE